MAPMLPIIKALKKAGNRVLSVLAGRSKDLIIMEDEVRANSDEVIIMTDDGSYGEKGVVTVGMEKFIEQEHCLLYTSNFIPGKDTDNLVVKAYKLLANDFDLPKIHIHLFKQIPIQAGLGGGSSDAAYMLKLLNEQFSLNLTIDKLKDLSLIHI